MSPSLLLRRLFCAVALISFTATSAHAFCTIFNAPPPRYVGDTASDGKCTDNTIQSAIDFVKNAGYVCPATIYITREHLYTNQHLTIDNVSTPLNLVGEGDGVQCGSSNVQLCDPDTGCPPPPTVPLVTINGSGSGGRVLSIAGNSNITLRYLEITGGNLSGNPSGDGGGIGFEGTGLLTLDTSEIYNNSADYGGGVNFNGTGTAGTNPPAVLQLNQNTLILDNTANTSGGGIRIEGDAQLLVLQPKTLIEGNHAPGGYGGGIEVLGPATADIGSPGYNGLAVIYDNDAKYGGGIAAYSPANGEEARINLFTVDPLQPVQVANNVASATGGGIFLHPHYTVEEQAEARLCAFDFRIDDNVAQEGAAIYADEEHFIYIGGTSYHGGIVALNTDVTPDGATICNAQQRLSLGAVSCAIGTRCNTIQGNVNEDDGGSPTTGATILMQSDGTLAARQFVMLGNIAGNTIRAIGETNEDDLRARFSLNDCLVADNTVSSDLIQLEGSYFFGPNIDGCTIADNSIGSDFIVQNLDRLTDSLVFQPSKLAGAVSSSYVLANDTSMLHGDGSVLFLNDPKFVDAAHQDYHLRIDSPAVDFAAASGGVDLDGYPRDIDLPTLANTYGPRDVGAYERQNLFNECGTSDSLFCDGFDH